MAQNYSTDSGKEKVLDRFNKRKEQHLEVFSDWRDRVRDYFGILDGSAQWSTDDYNRQVRDGIPVLTINEVEPIVDAINGFQIQNPTDIKYQPILTSQEGFTDVANSAIKYIQEDTDFEFHKSAAFRDMLTCGLGAVEFSVEYLENPDGEPETRRIFPAFVMWDVAARDKNLLDANWVARAVISDSEAVKEEYGEDYAAEGADDRFLQFFDNALKARNLSVVYHYEWREKEDFYRYENPFDQERAQLDPEYAQAYTELGQLFDFNPGIDRYIAVFESEKEEAFTAAMEVLGEKPKRVKQKRWCYYKAVIVGGRVYSVDQSFTNVGFTIQFMTGKFSETEQRPYGVVHAMADLQRLLNRGVSDLLGFHNSAPKGGVVIEADAVDNLQQFVETYAKARNVTVVKTGTISGNKMMEKQQMKIPDSITGMIEYASTALLRVAGVTPDFMGVMQGPEQQSGYLYAQKIRQALTTLAWAFDARKFFDKQAGRIFLDCVRVMAENAPGRMIRNVLGDGNIQYIPLLQENIAEKYDVIIQEVPQTPSEKQETFGKLLDMASILSGQGINITPMLLEFSPLPTDKKAEIQQQMTAPPPPPDPLVVQTQQATAANLMAEARYKDAQATKANMDALKTQKELQTGEAVEYPAEAAKDQREREKMAQDFELKQFEFAEEQRLELFKAELAQKTELQKAAIQAQTQLRVAAITAKMQVDEDGEVLEEPEAPPPPDLSPILEGLKTTMDGLSQQMAALAAPRTVILNHNANGTLTGAEVRVQ